jgi:hypothetical protein
MKKLIFSIALLISLTASAQKSYKLSSGGKLESTTSARSSSFKDSGYTLRLKDQEYTVYVSDRGKFFINRISAKTQKPYKQYINVE